MSKHDETDDLRELQQLLNAQRLRIAQLERQVSYLKKRFFAARQAVRWLESKLRWNMQDSVGI